MENHGGPLCRVVLLLLTCPLCCLPGWAADRTQWGQQHTRNQVSDEKGLPVSFDPATGKNIRWVARLGSETYCTPTVGSGKVLIGTNNHEPRDARHQGDRGVLMCFDERDGRFMWQLVVPKLGPDPYLDWPGGGIVSPPTIEGDRAYVVTNRGEVVCLDLHGLADGNDGPITDEQRVLAPPNSPPVPLSATDADLIWLVDLPSAVGIYNHDASHSSILLHGNLLYVNTSNGVDNTHRRIRCPEAPSLVVLDKRTGRLVAQDSERIGPNIVHCTWSSPALGHAGGRELVVFGGGDGVLYAFAALPEVPGSDIVLRLQRIWRFDCDPGAPKQDIHRYMGNRREGPSNIKSMPVFIDGRVYVTAGGDVWWGKKRAWLKCIDASGAGDITQSAQIWSYEMPAQCCSTPAIHDGLVYVADCGRTLHCVDAETGKPLWTHQLRGEIWGSPLVADGKVYIASRRGDFWVLEAGRNKHVLSTIDLDSAVIATPVAANGVLYVATMTHLYAVQEANRP